MPVEKSQLSNLRIAKKTYVFDQKRRFEHTGRFSLTRTTSDKPELKDVIESLLGKRKEFGSAAAQQPKARPASPSAGAKKPSRSLFGTILKTFIAILLLFALALFYVVSTAGSGSTSPPIPMAASFSGNFSIDVLDVSVLTAGTEESPSNIARFFVSYSTQNISSLSLTARLFPSKPQQQIYLLRSQRDSAESYDEFASTFAYILRAKGLPINEIDIPALQTLPSGSAIIIPSGYLPASLISGQPRNLVQIAAASNTIIYIGLPFDTTALSDTGRPVSVRTADSNALGINFTRSKPESTDGFSLFDGQYVVGTERLFGSVSVLRIGSGQILFLPQSLDGGWRGSGGSAAADVSRIISSSLWQSSFADAYEYLPTSSNSSGELSLLTSEFGPAGGYALFYIEARDSNGIMQGEFRTIPVLKEQRGDLFINYAGGPPTTSQISRTRTRMSVVLREQSSTPVKLKVKTLDGLEVLKTDDLESEATVPTITRFFDYDPSVLPGTYVLSVEDNAGKRYAASLLTVADVEVVPTSIGWKEGVFSFRITSAGEPIVARKISASIDGKHAGDYTLASDVRLIARDLQPGKHVFSFLLGDLLKEVELEYVRSRAFYDNPIAIFLGILAAVIFAIGFFLRLPEKMVFGLDIPDFPPLSAIKIPVRRSTVLEIFEQVNRDYSWSNMPLTLEEVKNGFRKLTYNGKPILVGDYNLERILSKLETENLLKHELSYYLLSEWEKKSSQSAFYLCAYRQMRDIFIANTIRFSKIGSQKDCDVKITLANKDAFVHIHQGQQTLAAALKTAPKGTTLVVFRDDASLSSFKSLLQSASPASAAFKMELDNGTIALLALAQLGSYLKGMRPS